MAMTRLMIKGDFARQGGLDLERIHEAMEASGQGPTVGAAAGRAGDWFGRKISGAFSSPLGDLRAADELKYNRAMQEMPAQKAEEMAELVRNAVASSPKFAHMINQTYGDAFGDISMARTANVGLGMTRDGTRTRMSVFKEGALARGYDPGERAGAHAALAGVAGRGLMGAGLSMLGYQYGGFGNAGQIYGVGAQFGLGGRSAAARSLLEAAQGGMGRGGIDVTAGSSLAGMVAGMMTGGNFSGGYRGAGNALMEGVMSSAWTGTTGGDMRMARVLQSGMGEYARNLSGATDPLQGGINMLAANASGASGWYAKKALMGMDPGQMIEALRSGKLPSSLSDQGVSIDMVRQYNSVRNQYAFSRYMDEEGGGSEVSRSVAGVKGAGSLSAYLKGKLHGVKGGAASREGQSIINREISRLATARRATEGGDLEANEGALRLELAGDTDLMPALGGKGAHAVGIKGTIQGEAAKEHARQAKELGEFQADMEKELKAAIRLMSTNEQQLAGMTKDLVHDAGEFGSALKTLTGAVMDALGTIAPAKAAELRKQAERNARDANKRTGPLTSHDDIPMPTRHEGRQVLTIPKVAPPRGK